MNKFSKILSIITVVLLAVLLIGSRAQATDDSVVGTWQGIIDGENGEGSFFYRFIFNEDGSVNVKKQIQQNYFKEVLQYSVEGNKITFVSSADSNLKELNDSSFIIKDGQIQFENGNYKGVISTHSTIVAVVHWLLTLVVLMLLNELLRQYKWSGFIFFIGLSICLLPIWLSRDVYWFKSVKLFSVVTACIWFTFMRFTKLGTKNYAKMGAAIFLAGNIAEAVLQDFTMGNVANVLNALAGLFSIITLFYGWRLIKVNKENNDMVWNKMTIWWIIGYDIWNFVYVYLNFPGSASIQFMVILSCTIPALFIKKGTWLQARAFTLAAWFMYYFTFPAFTESVELLLPRSNFLIIGLGVISFVANAAYLVYYFFYMKKDEIDIELETA